MPSKTVKVTVSLPEEEYRHVEKVRRQLRISRSAVITRALKSWIVATRDKERIHAYMEGYRRYPETKEELKMFESLASEVMSAEEWKE